MSTLTVEQIIERVDRIPRLPSTAVRLVSVVCDPGSSIAEIVDAIRFDQAVTADVLRLCNSAYFGLSRRVDSLEAATRLLGTAKILQLVMAAHTRSLLGRAQSGYGLAPGALWEHSVAVAHGCQLYARQFGLGQLGMRFTAGLLHDIGKVVLNEFVGAEYAEIVRCVSHGEVSFIEAEQSVLGLTHAEVGARLAEEWSLPEELIRCIRHHHSPDALPEPDPAVDAVHLADATCLLMGIGGGEVDGLAYRVHPDVLRRRQVSQRGLELIGAEVVAEVRAVRALLAGNS